MSASSKEFVHSVKIRFGQVDAAGIVFHPRYFEMINNTIEDWFAHLGFPFAKMHLTASYGVPLVHIAADFHHPSRLGEDLDFVLRVVKIGRSSLKLALSGQCQGKTRLSATVVLAYVDLKKGKAAAWNATLRKAIERWV